MRDFATRVDWTKDAANLQVDSIARASLLRFVNDYRGEGSAAMVQYDDNHAVKSYEAFAALLDQSGYLRDFAPGLRDYLELYPTRVLKARARCCSGRRTVCPTFVPR